MSSTKPAKQQQVPIQQRLLILAKQSQFIWFLGHVLLLLSSTRYLISVVTFSASQHSFSYRLAFFGSLITYGIVLFKTYSDPRTRGAINLQLAAKIWADENMQYFTFAAYWCFVASPVLVALLPYTIFSVFHALTYINNNIMPSDSGFAKTTAKFTKDNHEQAMKLVSQIEVLGLGTRTLLGLISFGYLGTTSLSTALIVVSFLRYRYATSAITRQTCTNLGLQIDHALSDQRVPPAILSAWKTIKGLMSTYLGHAPVKTQ